MSKNFEQKKFNKSKGPKPVLKTIPMVFTGKDHRGNDYDIDSCKTIMKDLQDSGCFAKLFVSVNISRDRIVPGAKGIINLGRLQKYDTETGDVEIFITGKNIENAELISDMVIVPRVRTNRNTNEVVSITSFEIVPIMEA